MTWAISRCSSAWLATAGWTGPSCATGWSRRHYETAIANQFQEGLNLGINGIPGFLIGNILFTGARPYSVFKAVMGKLQEAGQQGEARP